MMHRCIISLAANCQQEENLARARECLGRILTVIRFTEELWTDPVGTVRRPDKYLNQLLYAETALCVEELVDHLKEIEIRMGRTDDDRRQGIVRIDLDLMQYDKERFHLRDWERPYIQSLLANGQ
jgi:2-amino-4-hydroxy-6-hydroxymethyldihydropteridine diphosphokinase